MNDIFEKVKKEIQIKQLYDYLDGLKRKRGEVENGITARIKEREKVGAFFDKLKKTTEDIALETQNNYLEIERAEVEENMHRFWEEYSLGLKTIMLGQEFENMLSPLRVLMNKCEISLVEQDEAINSLRQERSRIEGEIAEIQRQIREVEGF